MNYRFNTFLSDRLLWFILGSSCLLAYYNFILFFFVFNIIFWALIFFTRQPKKHLRTLGEKDSFYAPLFGRIRRIENIDGKTEIIVQNRILKSWGILASSYFTVKNVESFKAKKYWKLSNLIKDKIYLQYRITMSDTSDREIVFEIFSSILGGSPSIEIDVGDEISSGAIWSNLWGVGAIKIILEEEYDLLVKTGQEVNPSTSVMIQRNKR